MFYSFKGNYENIFGSNVDRKKPYLQQNEVKSSINRNYGDDYENAYERQTDYDYNDIADSQGFDPFKYIGESVGENLDYNYFSDY